MKILAWATTLVAYFLMVLGNVVTATGSGLACPDWPTCHGSFTPFLWTNGEFRWDILLEWGHRVSAFLFIVLGVATSIVVWRNSKKFPLLKRPLKFFLTFILIQATLGGITVMLHLSTLFSSIHLVLATLLFSSMITVACVVTYEKDLVVIGKSKWSKKFQRYAVATVCLLLLQFALGAVVRHSGGGLACPNFPSCLGSFFPIPATLQTIVHFSHRWIGFLILGAFIHLFIASQKAPEKPLSKLVYTVSIIAVFQVLLGVSTVTSGLETVTRAVHAGLGYALWALCFILALRAGGFKWLWTKA